MNFSSVQLGFLAAGIGILAMAGEFLCRIVVRRRYLKAIQGATQVTKVDQATKRDKNIERGVRAAFFVTLISALLAFGAAVMTDKDNEKLLGRVSSLETTLQTIDKRVSELEKKPPPPGLNAEAEKDLASIRETIKDLRLEVDALVRHVTAQAHAAAALNEQFKHIDGRLKRLEQKPQPGF